LLLDEAFRLDLSPDADGASLLVHAAQKGHIQVVQFLLDRGADPSVQDRRGRLPMVMAAHSGQLEVVRILREKGVDPEIADGLGKTALTTSVNKGHHEITELLLDDRQKPAIPGPNGKPLFMINPLFDGIYLLCLSLTREADSGTGVVPLVFAAAYASSEVEYYLLGPGSDSAATATDAESSPTGGHTRIYDDHAEFQGLRLEKLEGDGVVFGATSASAGDMRLNVYGIAKLVLQREPYKSLLEEADEGEAQDAA
jgi:hypothetical protein